MELAAAFRWLLRRAGRRGIAIIGSHAQPHQIAGSSRLDSSVRHGLAQNNLPQTIDRTNWSELSRVAFEQPASAMDSVCMFGELFTILEL